MFAINSDITIGNFRFSEFTKISITRSMFTYVDVATITLPATCRIRKNGTVMPETITTATQFAIGDKVTILLGYNNDLQTEFAGFVTKCSTGRPLEISCEGYSYLLKKNMVSTTGNETVQELVRLASPNAVCNITDKVEGIKLDKKGGDILLDTLNKACGGTLTLFFIKPDTLWAGMPYNMYASGISVSDAPLVYCQPGYNVPDENKLTRHKPKDAQVVFTQKLPNGKVITTAPIVSGEEEKKTVNGISVALMQQLADEKQRSYSYTGYEGSITCFLQPFIGPGYTVYVHIPQYPELDGSYLAESTELTVDEKGARRKVSLGPRKYEGKKPSPSIIQ